MNSSSSNQWERSSIRIKACQGCGLKDGDVRPDGEPVKVEEDDGEWLCADCREVLADVHRWV
jgi:hypothetical protein